MRNEDYIAQMHMEYSKMSGVEKTFFDYEQSKERTSGELRDAIKAVDLLLSEHRDMFDGNDDKW